jgi:hypothetical protein
LLSNGDELTSDNSWLQLLKQFKESLKTGIDKSKDKSVLVRSARILEAAELTLNHIDVIPDAELRTECNLWCRSLLEDDAIGKNFSKCIKRVVLTALIEKDEPYAILKWHGFSCMHAGIDFAESAQENEGDEVATKLAIEELNKGSQR